MSKIPDVIQNPDGENFKGTCNRQECVFVLTNETLKFLDNTVHLNELSNITREEEKLGDNTEMIVYKPEVNGKEMNWSWQIIEGQEDFEEYIVTLINEYQDLDESSEGEYESEGEEDEEDEEGEDEKKDEVDPEIAAALERKKLEEALLAKMMEEQDAKKKAEEEEERRKEEEERKRIEAQQAEEERKRKEEKERMEREEREFLEKLRKKEEESLKQAAEPVPTPETEEEVAVVEEKEPEAEAETAEVVEEKEPAHERTDSEASTDGMDWQEKMKMMMAEAVDGGGEEGEGEGEKEEAEPDSEEASADGMDWQEKMKLMMAEAVGGEEKEGEAEEDEEEKKRLEEEEEEKKRKEEEEEKKRIEEEEEKKRKEEEEEKERLKLQMEDEEKKKKEEEEEERKRIEEEELERKQKEDEEERKKMEEEEEKKKKEEEEEKAKIEEEERVAAEERSQEENEKEKEERLRQENREEELRLERERDEERRLKMEEEESLRKEEEIEERKKKQEQERLKELEEEKKMAEQELSMKRSKVKKIEKSSVQLQIDVHSMIQSNIGGPRSEPFEISIDEENKEPINTLKSVVQTVMGVQFKDDVFGEMTVSDNKKWVLFNVTDEGEEVRRKSRDDWEKVYLGVHASKKYEFQRVVSRIASKGAKTDQKVSALVADLSAAMDPAISTAFKTEHFMQFAVEVLVAPLVLKEMSDSSRSVNNLPKGVKYFDLSDATDEQMDSSVCLSSICMRVSPIDPVEQAGFGYFLDTFDLEKKTVPSSVEREFTRNLRVCVAEGRNMSEESFCVVLDSLPLLSDELVMKSFRNLWDVTRLLSERNNVGGVQLLARMMDRACVIEQIISYTRVVIDRILQSVKLSGKVDIAEHMALQVVSHARIFDAGDEKLNESFDVSYLLSVLIEEFYELQGEGSELQKNVVLRMIDSLIKFYPMPVRKVGPIVAFLASVGEERVMSLVGKCLATLAVVLEKAGENLFLYLATFPKETMEKLNAVLQE